MSWSKAVLTVAGVTAAAHVGPTLTWWPLVRRQLFPGLDGQGRPASVALTFDDGPDPASTPALLEVLADEGVQATFFLLGEMVEKAPSLVGELVSAGHEIALHGWHHRNSLRVPPRALRDSLLRGRDLLQDLSGQPVRYYRPPYGVMTGGNVLAASTLGLQPVLWGSWGCDWTAQATPASVLKSVRADLRPGGTILLHDSDCTSAPGSWRSMLGAVRPLVADIQSQGLQLEVLSAHLI